MVSPDWTSTYADRVLRRRETVRLAVRLAWTAFAVSLTAGIVALLIWGDDWACHYGISRENYGVPDLTGLWLDEAREQVPTCVDVEPVDAALTDDSDARIVGQHPEPPDVLNHRRSIQVVLEPAR